MVAVSEWDLQEPPTITAAFHGVGRGIPAVEVAHQTDQFGLGSGAIEIDWFGRLGVGETRRSVAPHPDPFPIGWGKGREGAGFPFSAVVVVFRVNWFFKEGVHSSMARFVF